MDFNFPLGHFPLPESYPCYQTFPCPVSSGLWQSLSFLVFHHLNSLEYWMGSVQCLSIYICWWFFSCSNWGYGFWMKKKKLRGKSPSFTIISRQSISITSLVILTFVSQSRWYRNWWRHFGKIVFWLHDVRIKER